MSSGSKKFFKCFIKYVFFISNLSLIYWQCIWIFWRFFNIQRNYYNTTKNKWKKNFKTAYIFLRICFCYYHFSLHNLLYLINLFTYNNPQKLFLFSVINYFHSFYYLNFLNIILLYSLININYLTIKRVLRINLFLFGYILNFFSCN